MIGIPLLVALAALAVIAVLSFNTAWIPSPIDDATKMESAITKTATYAGTTLDLGSGFAPKNAGQPFGVVINTTALDLASGNENYAAAVQQSADNATWVTISPSVSITATGVLSIPVHVSQRYVRVGLTLAGTTPSITCSAWLAAIK